MPDRKHRVIQTEQLDEDAHRWLAERVELVVSPWEDRAALDALLPSADGLLIRTYTKVDDALLDKAPKLKVVARAGVGLDNVDLAACARRGVTVVSTPGANTRAVIELVTAFMLDSLRPREYLAAALDPKSWNAARKCLTADRQLADLTLGIVGFGRVGSGIARVAQAMNMRVVYHDLLDIPADQRAGAEPASFEHVLKTADILTIHVDGRRKNRNLISTQALGLLKPNVLFINTSRGMVVDAPALAAFLHKNTGARAYMDVHEPEPVPADHPLFGMPNAKLTPHIGAATKTAHANMSWVVKDLWRVLNGEAPEHPASPEPD